MLTAPPRFACAQQRCRRQQPLAQPETPFEPSSSTRRHRADSGNSRSCSSGRRHRGFDAGRSRRSTAGRSTSGLACGSPFAVRPFGELLGRTGGRKVENSSEGFGREAAKGVEFLASLVIVPAADAEQPHDSFRLRHDQMAALRFLRTDAIRRVRRSRSSPGAMPRRALVSF